MPAITQKPDGTYIVTVRLTLKPVRDADLIELVLSAPRRGLAAAVRNAMRSGISVAVVQDKDEDIDLSGMGVEL